MNGSAEEEKARLEKLLAWFIAPLTPNEWSARKSAIEDSIEEAHRPGAALEHRDELIPLSAAQDRMGWYLYLLEINLINPYLSEPVQAARILPTFQRLADDFDLFCQVQGIENKRARLLGLDRANPDAGLFELLVALLWKRNGWQTVSFVPEAPPDKRHDLEATSGGVTWAIECKRLSKSSVYSEQERLTWLKLWNPLRSLLVERKYPIVLDVTFHVELQGLPDTYLVDSLADRLARPYEPGLLLSDDTISVKVGPVDTVAMRKHLLKNMVKYPSPQLNQLIGGKSASERNFTTVIQAKLVRMIATRGNNRFVDDIAFAAGCFWHCDAPRSIERKARDIRNRLAEAVEQIPLGKPAVIHIGLETLDGWTVEAERYRRIIQTVANFDLRGKNVRWVYCHLFQSYSPPDQPWVLDETVYYFGQDAPDDRRPLKRTGTIAPLADVDGPGVHWLKPSPYGGDE